MEAVKLFQEKYRADILDPQKIEKATGEVKLATREKLNAVCFPSGNTTAQLNITLTIAKQEPFNAVAQIIKNQWAKIGVTVNINAVDIANIERDIVKPRAYEALLFGQALGMIPDPYPFWHSSQKADPGLNFALYENKDADKLLEEIRGLTDQNAREEKLQYFPGYDSQRRARDIPLQSKLYFHRFQRCQRSENRHHHRPGPTLRRHRRLVYRHQKNLEIVANSLKYVIIK